MLIAIEGIDAAGKNTLTQHVVDIGRASGWSVDSMTFPRYGNTLSGVQIGRYLRGEFGELHCLPPEFPALLFALDRFESMTSLDALRRSNDVLIFDRYVASNAAYQAARVPPSDREAFIDWMSDLEHGLLGIPQCDLNIFVDMPLDVAEKLLHKGRDRSYTLDAADLHEVDRDFIGDVCSVYLDLIAKGRFGPWHTLQCVDDQGYLRSPKDLAQEVWAVIQQLHS